jgi:aminopeptidase-like protein
VSSIREGAAALDAGRIAAELLAWIERAYPLPRSLTGAGVRATFDLIDDLLAAGSPLRLERHHLPSGAPMLDWTVPREWVLREAWIKGPDGTKVVDVAEHSLHLLGYSAPFRGRLSREELDAHLFSLPEQPELIPYRTSYWAERWGFCLPHVQREALPEGDYEVLVDTELRDGDAGGVMDWAELVIPGEQPGEVFLCAHVCHPSLANDNLSAIAVAAALARVVAEQRRRFGLRVLFAPATVGAIGWLETHRAAMPPIVAGLVLANLGDSGRLHWKQTFSGTHLVDRVAGAVVQAAGGVIEPFVPFGYDERQYNSPGFRLPVGCLSRTPWGRYPEYHTSADNPEFLDGEALVGSLVALAEICDGLEEGTRDPGPGIRRKGVGEEVGATDSTAGLPPPPSLVPSPGSRIPDPGSRFFSLSPYGEPQLGRRGLYRSLGGGSDRDRELALLWVLCLADGSHDLDAMVARSGLPREAVERAVEDLLEVELLAPKAGFGD